MSCRVLLIAFAALTTNTALAHGDGQHPRKSVDLAHVEQMPFGRAGDPKAATRTMTIHMRDTMRFEPAVLNVRRGETVRFVVRNDGKALHEMVLGTAEELKKHAELMRKFPDMEHDEPHMVHVKPGGTEEMVWTFNRAGQFEFACLVPGHFESGMVGKVVVK